MHERLLRIYMTKSTKSNKTKSKPWKLKCLNTKKRIMIIKLLLPQSFLYHAELGLYLKIVLKLQEKEHF